MKTNAGSPLLNSRKCMSLYLHEPKPGTHPEHSQGLHTCTLVWTSGPPSALPPDVQSTRTTSQGAARS